MDRVFPQANLTHTAARLSYQVYRTHFQDRPNLKNKTLDIFSALFDLLQASLQAIEKGKADLRELQKQIKTAKESEDRAVRKMKRTEAYHEKFLDERR